MMHQLPSKYNVAEREALRFIEAVAELRHAYQDSEYRHGFNHRPSRERAAVKRASLDLSRALSAMRNR